MIGCFQLDILVFGYSFFIFIYHLVLALALASRSPYVAKKKKKTTLKGQQKNINIIKWTFTDFPQ